MTASGSEVLRSAGVSAGDELRGRRWRVMCFSQARLSTMRSCWRIIANGNPLFCAQGRFRLVCRRTIPWRGLGSESDRIEVVQVRK